MWEVTSILIQFLSQNLRHYQGCYNQHHLTILDEVNLASVLDMNREEKQEYVIQLYKENRSTREIAKLTHMSFRDIGTITKKLEAHGERGPLEEDDDIKSKSKITQAFKLFSEFK